MRGGPIGPRGPQGPHPCPHCRHPDGRDATHARGCPRLAPVTQARMLEIALFCERGWLEAEAARRERAAELVRRRARGAAA